MNPPLRALVLSVFIAAGASGQAMAQEPKKPAETEEARAARVEALLDAEGLGPLKLGQPAPEVVKHLGEPARRGKKVLQAADGMEVQDWSYPAAGLKLTLASEPGSKEPATLAAIHAGASCKLATQAGIKAGSTRAEVVKAYAGAEDPESRGEKDSFVVGSIYGGIIFSFSKGKVSGIFIGAAAE